LEDLLHIDAVLEAAFAVNAYPKRIADLANKDRGRRCHGGVRMKKEETSRSVCLENAEALLWQAKEPTRI
jgi:hypothetical protein